MRAKARGSRDSVVRLLDRNRSAVRAAWRKKLRQRWGRRYDAKAGALAGEVRRGRDLLSMLVRTALRGSERRPDYAPVLRRIRDPDYLISDFYLEVSCLEDAIQEVLRRVGGLGGGDLLAGLRPIRQQLSRIVTAVLRGTADVYEYSVERGGSGFCQVGRSGEIVFANEEMLRCLGRKSVLGKKLASFFEGEERQFLQDALTGEQGDTPRVRLMQLTRPNGERLPVAVEIAPLIIDGQHLGGYAGLLDISGPIRLQNQVLDKSPLGIVKANREGRFTYANPKASEIIGIEDMVGRRIRQLFPDKRSWEVVAGQMQRRYQTGESDEYDVTLTRPDKRRVPVRIDSMPEKDLQGRIIGSTAILRSLALEKATEAIHRHLEGCGQGQSFLQRAAEEIALVVPFDMMNVSVYSSDMRHVRPLLTYFREGSPIRQGRYWPVPPYVAKWIETSCSQHIPDIGKMLAQPEFRGLRKDPAIQGLMAQGLRSVFFTPVFHERKAVASLSFNRKQADAFSEKEIENLESLPLTEIAMTALYVEQRRCVDFRLDLMRDLLTVSDDTKAAAELITRRIVEHFRWNNASIFRVDEKNRQFRLISQTVGPGDSTFNLKEGYTQEIGKGILSLVYRKRKRVHIPDLRKDPRYKDCVKAFPHAQSELSVPIMSNRKVRWILNIEDSETNAFSNDDIRGLEAVLEEVSLLLGQARLRHLLQATFRSASDALMVTDGRGRVRRANPAVTTLLGHTQDELAGTSLRRVFAARKVFDQAMEGRSIASQEVALKAKDGTPVPVLLSASQLPEELGGVVFIAKDLSLLRLVEELEYLGQMYREIAIQTKTPLSLAYSWLRRLRDRTTDASDSETLTKTIQQLRKVELFYDRLALYDRKEALVPYNELLLAISEVIDGTLDALPRTERENITLLCDADLPPVRGDIFQLTFCLESILSYLLASLPQDEKILLRVSRQRNWITIRVKGFLPLPASVPTAETGRPESLSRALTDMALGEEVIRSFVRAHRGRYHEPARRGRQVEFRIDLPAERR